MRNKVTFFLRKPFHAQMYNWEKCLVIADITCSVKRLKLQDMNLALFLLKKGAAAAW